MTKTKGKGVPEGWLPVSPIGKPVSGTRFLAFKVPLKETLCNNLQPDERFSPAILMEKEPNLRLIIDLTNTRRYYNETEFTENGVNYEKIFCPGREVPPNNLMRKFFHVVDNFMKSEDTEDKFIGVHCTHGINRTGYFICTYMIQKMGFSPAQAISAFQEARGHEIIRDCFIQKLMKEEPANYLKMEKYDPSELPPPRKHHHQQPNRGFRSPPNRGRHRGRPYYNHPHPRDSFHQQSQLNYYDDANHYDRFQWRRGYAQSSRGRGHYSSRN